MTKPPTMQDMGWLLSNFADSVAGIAHVVAVSADGLLLWTPSRSQGSRQGRAYTVNVTVTDDDGASDTQAVTLTVKWVDADNDWEPDHAANEPVLLRHMGVAQGVMVRVNADETGIVKFRPNGFAADAAAGQVPTSNVVICDSRGTAAISAGSSAARAVLISATGRARVTRDKAEIDTALANIDEECP